MSDSGALSISALRREDHAEWRALWRGYLEFYESDVAEDVYAETWRRLLSGEKGEYCGVIARDAGGQAVGIAHYLFHRHCWRIEDVCYLQDLFVAPEARGAGVGEALIKSVYAAADAYGAGEVYWMTQHFNEKARALYDRVGQATPFIKYRRR